jgi:hypothetical protein
MFSQAVCARQGTGSASPVSSSMPHSERTSGRTVSMASLRTSSNFTLAGRQEEAKRAMTRLRQVDPALRICNLKGVLGPFRRAEDLARIEEGLRRAGLPE